MTQPDFKLAKVCWIDSRGVSDTWATFEQLREHGLCQVWSIGWVIKETDEYVQLCPHIGTDPDQGCGDMTIGKIAIISMEIDEVKSIPHEDIVS